MSDEAEAKAKNAEENLGLALRSGEFWRMCYEVLMTEGIVTVPDPENWAWR